MYVCTDKSLRVMSSCVVEISKGMYSHRRAGLLVYYFSNYMFVPDRIC